MSLEGFLSFEKNIKMHIQVISYLYVMHGFPNFFAAEPLAPNIFTWSTPENL